MILNKLFILSRNRWICFLKYNMRYDMHRYYKPNIFTKVSYVIFFYNSNIVSWNIYIYHENNIHCIKVVSYEERYELSRTIKKIIFYRRGLYNLMIHDGNLSKYKWLNGLITVLISCI